jgi:hypothetical protein
MNPEKITFDSLPYAIRLLLEKIEKIERVLSEKYEVETLPEIIPIKKAAEIAGKTPNALRVQISIGNLNCIRKGGRIFFNTKEFLGWLRGDELEPEE